MNRELLRSQGAVAKGVLIPPAHIKNRFQNAQIEGKWVDKF
jgi:hypothetical protein